jgi:hypothetical protein
MTVGAIGMTAPWRDAHQATPNLDVAGRLS